jgi:hypothetical protein
LYFSADLAQKKGLHPCIVTKPAAIFAFIIFLARVCPARADCPKHLTDNPSRGQTSTPHGFSI